MSEGNWIECPFCGEKEGRDGYAPEWIRRNEYSRHLDGEHCTRARASNQLVHQSMVHINYPVQNLPTDVRPATSIWVPAGLSFPCNRCGFIFTLANYWTLDHRCERERAAERTNEQVQDFPQANRGDGGGSDSLANRRNHHDRDWNEDGGNDGAQNSSADRRGRDHQDRHERHDPVTGEYFGDPYRSLDSERYQVRGRSVETPNCSDRDSPGYRGHYRDRNLSADSGHYRDDDRSEDSEHYQGRTRSVETGHYSDQDPSEDSGHYQNRHPSEERGRPRMRDHSVYRDSRRNRRQSSGRESDGDPALPPVASFSIPNHSGPDRLRTRSIFDRYRFFPFVDQRRQNPRSRVNRERQRPRANGGERHQNVMGRRRPTSPGSIFDSPGTGETTEEDTRSVSEDIDMHSSSRLSSNEESATVIQLPLTARNGTSGVNGSARHHRSEDDPGE